MNNLITKALPHRRKEDIKVIDSIQKSAEIHQIKRLQLGKTLNIPFLKFLPGNNTEIKMVLHNDECTDFIKGKARILERKVEFTTFGEPITKFEDKTKRDVKIHEIGKVKKIPEYINLLTSRQVGNNKDRMQRRDRGVELCNKQYNIRRDVKKCMCYENSIRIRSGIYTFKNNKQYQVLRCEMVLSKSLLTHK